jgi:hypothetical protein
MRAREELLGAGFAEVSTLTETETEATAAAA